MTDHRIYFASVGSIMLMGCAFLHAQIAMAKRPSSDWLSFVAMCSAVMSLMSPSVPGWFGVVAYFPILVTTIPRREARLRDAAYMLAVALGTSVWNFYEWSQQ